MKEKWVKSEIRVCAIAFKCIIQKCLITSATWGLIELEYFYKIFRGTQRDYGCKPLKHSFVKHILAFKR